MSTLTVESTRFGTLEIDADAVIEFPAGLIGLDGTRYALVSTDPEGAFHWLHSVEHDSLALPVTNPWLFFGDFVVDLSDADTDRVASDSPDVWVTVRTGSEPGDFSANLRAPILVADGRGHQVINEAPHAPVRAALFAEAAAGQAA
jgi:flagellar assembly factor FliW